MKLYRLKKEAVPYFKEKHATAIYSYETWEKLGIDDNALEEVKAVYLSCGHKINDISSTLSGWDKDGAHYEFTIHFPSMKFREYEVLSKGRMMRELMNEIESVINRSQEQFLNEQTNNQ